MYPAKYILRVVLLALVITGCALPDDTFDQIAEIRAKWNRYKPADTEDAYYAQTPKVTAPYAAGALTQAHLNDGLNMTKFVRYLAGLSENLYLDAGLTEQAQHGAVLLAALNNNLTHAPPQPADMDDAFYQKGKISCGSSNLFMESTKYNRNHSEDLDRAVRAFIHDTDIDNYTHVGHRRWVLYPGLQKLGFGLAERGQADGTHAYYVTMQIGDKSNTTDKVDMDYVSWPGKGYFPDDFFSGEQAWSVSLNPNVYDIPQCQPIVTLTNGTTGREWVFDKVGDTPTAVNLKFFYFNRQNSGWPGCIIFRPDGLENMSSTENRLRDVTFEVAITGLVRKDGKSGSIAYQVTFFEL
jgi:hypothetical protein